MASDISHKERDPKLDIFEEYESQIVDLQKDLFDTVLPKISNDHNLFDDPTSLGVLNNFISDKVTVFRFFRRANFEHETSVERITKTLEWRLSVNIDSPSQLYIDPIYTHSPFLTFMEGMHDVYGRPCTILRLCNVQRDSDGSLGPLREFISLAWESCRRRLKTISEQTGKLRIQMVLLVDLKGATMTNMEIELLPYLLDLLKSHFPGMVGAIYIINYTWLYAGMWAIAKKLIPQIVLDRILFPTQEELLLHFKPENLPLEYGGTLSGPYICVTDLLGVPRSTTCRSRSRSAALSRKSSLSNINSNGGPDAQQISRAIDQAARDSNHTRHHHSRTSSNISLHSNNTATTPSPFDGSFPPQAVNDYEYNDELGIVENDGSMSPYNPLNPYYGYPLSHWRVGALDDYPDNQRRRKRDLVRTLLYLFLRRILSVRRQLFLFLGLEHQQALQQNYGQLSMQQNLAASGCPSKWKRAQRLITWIIIFVLIRSPSIHRWIFTNIQRLKRR